MARNIHMNNNSFLEAAEKIADLADEYSHISQLSTVLKAGASKLMEKSGSYFLKKQESKEK